MKIRLTLLAALCCLLSFVSCSEEDPLANYDPTVKAKITVNRNSFDAECDTSRFVTRIKSTYLWKIDIPAEADWITASQYWGDSLGTYKVYFYIDANTTTAERSCVITIHSGKSKKTINVTQARQVRILNPADVSTEGIYIPQELRGMDLYKSSSKWYYGRSRQSDHVIVFWQRGENWDEYGDVTPTECSNSSYRVDIDDLLQKAETFYTTNVEKLKFCETGQGKSTLDKYKFLIFLNHQSDWLATGSGYDNVIGALWVSPNTCQPVGSTIAHEVGHSFQYMTFCDWLLQQGVAEDERIDVNTLQGPGWRYGFGSKGAGGNAFWEQTAQWQSFVCYPGEIFSNYYYQGYLDAVHLHNFHEDPRYSNYFIHWYWAHCHGIEEVGRLWRESQYPEDPWQTYQRLHGLSLSELNDEIFEYARRMVTWDMDDIRSRGKSQMGKVTWKYTKADGWFKVAVAKCPQSTGFNVITLKDFTAGDTVRAEFAGITDDQSYHIVNPDRAGWRYGFVAYCSDGSRAYSDIFSQKEGTAQMVLPENCTKLWLVVSATPTVYERHAWDDDSSNDAVWPYKVRFEGTTVR